MTANARFIMLLLLYFDQCFFCYVDFFSGVIQTFETSVQKKQQKMANCH